MWNASYLGSCVQRMNGLESIKSLMENLKIILPFLEKQRMQNMRMKSFMNAMKHGYDLLKSKFLASRTSMISKCKGLIPLFNILGLILLLRIVLTRYLWMMQHVYRFQVIRESLHNPSILPLTSGFSSLDNLDRY